MCTTRVLLSCVVMHAIAAYAVTSEFDVCRHFSFLACLLIETRVQYSEIYNNVFIGRKSKIVIKLIISTTGQLKLQCMYTAAWNATAHSV